MNPITRRSFGKFLLGFTFLPIAKSEPPSTQIDQGTTPGLSVPDTIAGHRLTADEKELTVKFLATHEKNMAPLRQHDLPNNRPPGILFSSPMMKKREGGTHD